MKGTRWSEEEDAALGCAWSTVAAQGVNQGSAKFWESVYATFKELAPGSARNRKGLRNRWCNTQKDVIKFHGVYTSVEQTTDALHTALWLYQQKYKQTFELLHCWREVKTSPKFLENVLKVNGNMQLLQAAVESRTSVAAAITRREEVVVDEQPPPKRRKHVVVMPRPAVEPSATPLTGNAAPPPWFEQAMQDLRHDSQQTMADLRHEHQQATEELRRENKQLSAQLASIQDSLTPLLEFQGQMRNGLVYKRSREDPSLLDAPLSVYRKWHLGLHEGHPGPPSRLASVPDVAVGALLPSPPFPATLRDLSKMTLKGIKALSMLMHDTFGIEPVDSIDERIAKVRKHLLYRV